MARKYCCRKCCESGFHDHGPLCSFHLSVDVEGGSDNDLWPRLRKLRSSRSKHERHTETMDRAMMNICFKSISGTKSRSAPWTETQGRVGFQEHQFQKTHEEDEDEEHRQQDEEDAKPQPKPQHATMNSAATMEPRR